MQLLLIMKHGCTWHGLRITMVSPNWYESYRDLPAALAGSFMGCFASFLRAHEQKSFYTHPRYSQFIFLRGCRQVFRTDHPITLEVMDLLAGQYEHRCELEKSVPLIEENIDVAKKTWGEEDSETFNAMLKLTSLMPMRRKSSCSPQGNEFSRD